MSKQSAKSEYMLLFRGTHWDKSLPSEEVERVMSRWNTWMEQLSQQGKIAGGHALDRYEGKIVSWKKGFIVADGPFAESKEAIGGFFLLQVDDLEEAVEIAKRCPALEYGLDVEVRPLAEKCPPFQRVKEQQREPALLNQGH
jgi:hypothetical protein